MKKYGQLRPFYTYCHAVFCEVAELHTFSETADAILQQKLQTANEFPNFPDDI